MNDAGKNGHQAMSQPNYADAFCWRCDVSVLGLIPRVATLAGGYKAILCPRCLNDWEVYARDHHLIREADRLIIKENQTSQRVCRDEIERVRELLEIRDLIVANRKELFELAEGFCHFPIERAAPSRPPRSPEELRALFEGRRERLMAELVGLKRMEEAARTAGATP